MKRQMFIVAALALLPGAALADKAAADACAGGLSKDGKLIYSQTAPTIKPSTDIKDAMRSVARPLVMNGTLTRDAALTAAEAAGECLKLLK
ncbi:hypothetical protein [Reyranella sp.]|uniref:hypothetical protein n=1 Tax=Reyranella sp. TaxID=1929291 RepID=UPI003BAB3247